MVSTSVMRRKPSDSLNKQSDCLNKPSDSINITPYVRNL